jgi:hypothetical protein
MRGIQRTACTQNTDNPLAIAQFTELATGLNDTVTGVHVAIGSVSKSVHAIQEKSDKIMQVLNSVQVMQNDTFPTILRLELEQQALQLKFDREKEELIKKSTRQKAEIEQLTQESTSRTAEIDRLTAAQISTDNKCQTPVPPVAAGKGSLCYYVCMSIMLVFNVLTFPRCDERKNMLCKYFKNYATDAEK